MPVSVRTTSKGDLKWMKGDVPTPHGNIHIEMTKKKVSIEATGCGSGTLVIDNKHIQAEPGKKAELKI